MAAVATSTPYSLAAGDGLADVWWKTGRVTVKAGGAETGGSFAQVEVNDPRGTATPRHIHHNEDETFYVVEGEITVFVGAERIDLAEGDFAFAPRGVDHAYIVRSESARMLVTASPAGLEDVFVELGEEVTGGEPPAVEVMPPLDELIRAFGARGCEITGPPPTLAEL